MVEDDRGESFLTVAEVAGWLKLNQQTVRNWIDQGSLPAVRVGRRVRIKRSDLDQLLESGYQGGGAVVAADSGPSAADFWSGEAVGMADVDKTDEAGAEDHDRAVEDHDSADAHDRADADAEDRGSVSPAAASTENGDHDELLRGVR